MKIASINTFRLSIPFSDGGAGLGMTPSLWNKLDFVLVRIETECGLVGWGEAFSYFCAGSVKSILDETVIPMLIGADVSDPAAVSEMLQRNLVLFGRYGITIFAISGIDIALWDLKGKAADKPVRDLIGGTRRKSVPAYASLVRYQDPTVAALFTSRARDEGFSHIKLHEVTREVIRACDEVRGAALLMVDVNCSWEAEEAKCMAEWLSETKTFWLEEPTFPPEDFSALKTLAKELPLSGGENLCTVWQFRHLIESGNVRYPQPSVTKVGGVSEFIKIINLANQHNAELMPHSPYFGPGYLATLHIASTLVNEPLFEYLYVWPEAQLYRDMPLPKKGRVFVPDAPGFGLDPDPDVIREYLVP